MDRQKLLIIFGGAWVSAALLTWFLYATVKAPRTEKLGTVIAAKRDMPAGTRLRKDDLRPVKIASADLPKGVMTEEKQVLDRILILPVSANETITDAKLARANGAEGLAATIEPGKRAIAVPITDTSGVALLIQPRAHVDVLFTRPGSMSEAVTTTVIEDVVVLSIGKVTESTSAATTEPKTGAAAVQATTTTARQQAATLLVTPEQAAKLELCKNQGKISLSLRNPLDRSVIENNEPTTAETLDLGDFVGPRKKPNLRDDKEWAKLTAEDLKPKKAEPPKPRAVIDVFRGDKHVQEVFQ